jgi:hypothetical protein
VDGLHALIATAIEDWAPAVLRLMEDAELRARIAANGRALCAEHYTVASQWPRVRKALTAF